MHEMTPPALWPSRNSGRPGSRCLAMRDQALEVVDVVLDLLDVVALAVGLAAAAQVEGVDREAARLTSCSAAQKYWPLCELTPWQIATTARGVPSGRHER